MAKIYRKGNVKVWKLSDNPELQEMAKNLLTNSNLSEYLDNRTDVITTFVDAGWVLEEERQITKPKGVSMGDGCYMSRGSSLSDGCSRNTQRAIREMYNGK